VHSTTFTEDDPMSSPTMDLLFPRESRTLFLLA
jgi:hypothetical protein